MIPQEIGNLVNLAELAMEINQITGLVPISILNISSLQLFSLSMNNFSGFLPQEISNLTKMQNLQIGDNKLIAEIPKEISNLVELEVLDLSGNSFSGSLDMEIFNISGVRVISISNNNLSGSLPPNMCSLLPNIEKFYMNDLTNLVGTIPHSISNCSELAILELSNYQLSGLIPNSLGHLAHLQFLNLERNNLTSDSTLSFLTSLTSCRNLTFLSVYLNPLNGMLPASTGNLSTSLRTFVADIGRIKGQIPNEVGNLSSLLDLSLSGNNLVGSIPTSIGNLRDLQRFNLSSNKFTGYIGDHIWNITSLREIHLGSNKLSSNIPPSLGNLEDLVVLDISSNNMVGSLPPEIVNLKAATLIDLSMNQFSNGIPTVIGGLKNLANLSFETQQVTRSYTWLNEQHGIEEVKVRLSKLSHCLVTRERISYSELLQATDDLSESNLIGFGSFGSVYKGVLRSGTAIAVKVFNPQLDTECEVLRSLRHRNLVKVITSFSNLDFKALVLDYMPNGSLELYLYSHNYFLDIKQRLGIMIDVACALEYLHHGCSLPVIHCDMKPSNVLLDEYMVAHLSDFGISKLLGEDQGDLYTKTLAIFGYIAPGNITFLREIHLGSNKFSSNIPPSLGNLQDLVVLDLSSNNVKLEACKIWQTFLLRHNKLQGDIPDSMSNMVGLEFLDLSHNNISGIIPKCLEKLQNLKYFNVSVNKLYGEIPSGGPSKNLSSQFFIHNEALCGSSRFRVPPCPTSSKHKSNREKFLVLFLLLAIAVVFVTMDFVLLWIRYRRGKSAPQQAESLSNITRERISYYELLQETDDLSESNLIGFGNFGSVYKGILRSGTAIAVKVFKLQMDAAFKSFDTECDVLCSLRHRNLVKVITSCSNLDFKALVLEYMPNGSLEKYFYSHNYFLDTNQRLSIMIDVACALEYLHHGCSLPVINCDVKPSNVLLDEDMVAHLSDFDISKLLGEDQGDLYTKTIATLGYIAPEYGLDGLVSTKCDVYSYGIMLLETFTKRKPYEFEGDLSLKHWVSYSLPEAVMDVVDVNLVTPIGNRLQKELDVVASILKVALDCCAESPARRTNMKDVVAMLQKIKIQLLAC
ncbi:hypothetical protein P3L10_014211 [Capsicum annuum]